MKPESAAVPVSFFLKNIILIFMGKAFQAFNHGTGKIDLSKHKNIAVGEISLEMLNDGLADIGYKVVKQ